VTRVEAIELKATLVEQLGYARETYAALLQSKNKRYRFADAVGEQQATRRSLKELREEIQYLETEIANCDRIINGVKNVLPMTVRRRP
jgi:hypothetical protein